MKRKLAIVVAVLAIAGCCVAVGCAGQPDRGTASSAAPAASSGAEASSTASAAAQAATASYASVEEFSAAHSTIHQTNAMAVAMSNMKCKSCHDMDEEELYAAWQADPESVTVGRDKCTTCHREAKWPDDLEATYDNIKHWDTYVAAGSEEHQAWVASAMQYTTGRPPMGDYEQECAACHKMHGERQLMFCTQCHHADQGTGDCMACHERILGEGMEFEGKTAEEATAVLMERLAANGGHIDSVMTAPDGWDSVESRLAVGDLAKAV